ncbi:hypothetical protein JCM15765_39640 [Paradesulfitobacterium aromaticivorans]
MKFKNEDDIKKVLEIDSWKNLSKDKMIRFAAMMPDMDKEVAFKIIEKLPEFTKFATDALDVMEKEHKSSLTANKESQDNVHNAYHEIREILKGELEKENQDAEYRKHIVDSIMETGKKEFDKDSENKKFIDGLFSKGALGIAGLVLTAVVFVGGKVLLQRNDES